MVAQRKFNVMKHFWFQAFHVRYSIYMQFENTQTKVLFYLLSLLPSSFLFFFHETGSAGSCYIEHTVRELRQVVYLCLQVFSLKACTTMPAWWVYSPE